MHAMSSGPQFRRDSHSVQRGNRARRGKAAFGGDNPDTRRQRVQRAGGTPFVEVPCNHSRQGGQRCQMTHDCLQLQMSKPPDQPQMGTNHPQWTDARLHIRPNGTSRLQSRQI